MRALTPEEAAEIDTPHMVYGLDADGRSVGLVTAAEAFAIVSRPAVGSVRLDFTSGQWVRDLSLGELKAEAEVTIDRAAGCARCRYITNVPGQEAVYLRKYQQAQDFKEAGYTGPVPPYVAAEALAINDTPQAATDGILATASLWDDVISPGIEYERIAGKRAARAAGSPGDVEQAVSSTTATLEGMGPV